MKQIHAYRISWKWEENRAVLSCAFCEIGVIMLKTPVLFVGYITKARVPCVFFLFFLTFLKNRSRKKIDIDYVWSYSSFCLVSILLVGVSPYQPIHIFLSLLMVCSKYILDQLGDMRVYILSVRRCAIRIMRVRSPMRNPTIPAVTRVYM